MKTIHALFAAALCAAYRPAVSAAEVAFDQGVDAIRLLDHRDPSFPQPPYYETGNYRYTRDCRDLLFPPGTQNLSRALMLESRLEKEVCDNDKRENCRWLLLNIYHRRTGLSLVNRTPIYPWELDAFRVCVEGPRLEAEILSATHDYDMQGPDFNDLFIANALRKIPTNPDPEGLKVSGWGSAKGRMTLTFQDQWASYYPGEKTELSLSLYREGDFTRFGPPKTLLKNKVLSLDPAASYIVELTDFAKEFKEALTPAYKYYVQWSFRRAGQVSRPVWVSGPRTGKTWYEQP